LEVLGVMMLLVCDIVSLGSFLGVGIFLATEKPEHR
jgi:hypothetical protein